MTHLAQHTERTIAINHLALPRRPVGIDGRRDLIPVVTRDPTLYPSRIDYRREASVIAERRRSAVRLSTRAHAAHLVVRVVCPAHDRQALLGRHRDIAQAAMHIITPVRSDPLTLQAPDTLAHRLS